jgi:hypothetical protein
MIYLDTSVALAHLLAEDRRPPDGLWAEELVSSRLLEYELWNRLHARELGRSHGDVARLLLSRLAWLEMRPAVLERALRPFAAPVRTSRARAGHTARELRPTAARGCSWNGDRGVRALVDGPTADHLSMPCRWRGRQALSTPGARIRHQPAEPPPSMPIVSPRGPPPVLAPPAVPPPACRA